MTALQPNKPRVTNLELFLGFAHITLISFGGVLFWSRRMIVERRRWMTEQEFVEVIALSHVLPGVNGINLAVMIGHHFSGWRGAAAAFAGFLAPPCVMVTAIGALYARYGTMPLVQHALAGMSAVAVGLLLATAAKMATVLQRRWRPWVFVLLTILGVGVIRWPLLAVLAVIAPIAVAVAWKGRL